MKKRVDLNNLPGNSVDRNRTPKHNMIGKVSSRTKKDNRMSSEIRNIAMSLFEEIILPSIKGALSDFVTSGIDMIIWGGTDGPSRGLGRHVNYNKQYNPTKRGRLKKNRTPARYKSRRDSLEVDEIFFTNRMDAEHTLVHLLETLAMYGWVTVGDLYQAIGWSTTPTHERYGWDSLEDSQPRRVGGGFVLDLPEPVWRN